MQRNVVKHIKLSQQYVKQGAAKSRPRELLTGTHTFSLDPAQEQGKDLVQTF